VNAPSRFGIAFVVALVMGGSFALAVESAWFPVRPRALCVMPLGTGDHLVHFGYINETANPIEVALGSRNALEDGARSESMPTTFLPGSVGTAEQPAFVAMFSGPRTSWTLGPRTIDVDIETVPRCPVVNVPVAPPDLAMLMPQKPPEPPPEPPKPPEPEPEPPPEAPKPPEKPPEAVEPPKPRERTQRPKPKDDKPADPAQTAKPDEPIALQIQGLTNLSSGIAINSGDRDSLGSAAVRPTEENTRPPAEPREGTKDGTDADVPKRAPVRREARVLSSPKGVWPEDAPPRAGAVQVRLSLRVGTDGLVKEVRIVKKAGDAFDRAARAVGLKVTFSPATVDGEPVEVWVPWTVEFAPVGW
jgi:protein TonB